MYLNLRNAKRLCLFCHIEQKHSWNYFAFKQSSSSFDLVVQTTILPHEISGQMLSSLLPHEPQAIILLERQNSSSSAFVS